MGAVAWSPAERNFALGVGVILALGAITTITLTILQVTKACRIVTWSHDTTIGAGSALTIMSGAVSFIFFRTWWKESHPPPNEDGGPPGGPQFLPAAPLPAGPFGAGGLLLWV